MMAYKLKVTFAAGGKEYLPGDILPADIASSDFEFLKSKKFIEIVDIPEGLDEEFAEDFEGLDEEFFLKSMEEVKRIRSKREAAAYAALIGLDLGDYEKKSLKELQEEILNYQEEYKDSEERQESEEDGDD